VVIRMSGGSGASRPLARRGVARADATRHVQHAPLRRDPASGARGSARRPRQGLEGRNVDHPTTALFLLAGVEHQASIAVKKASKGLCRTP